MTSGEQAVDEPRVENWPHYVRRVMQQDTQMEAAKRTGVSQKTISNWLTGVGSGEGQRKPEAGNVAKFATGYGESVLVAFVAARLLAVEDCEGRVAVAAGLLVRAGSASTTT